MGPVSTKSLVACNVYITAGSKPHHAPLLLNILEEAQALCLSFRRDASNNNDDVARLTEPTPAVVPSSLLHDYIRENVEDVGARVVHAFTDRVYNRSSFHLAGTAAAVAKLASNIARRALQSLRASTEDSEDSNREVGSSHVVYPHPTIGLVDHIAVMPLIGRDDTTLCENTMGWKPTTASGWAAHRIGQELEHKLQGDDSGPLRLSVLYYGSAHPQGHPLAQVRREQTNFFQSVRRKDDPSSSNHASSYPANTLVVGAPPCFVENVNLRLSSSCSLAQARSLTRAVRALSSPQLSSSSFPTNHRGDGTNHEDDRPSTRVVEALTLPYQHGQWEVACNLLDPTAIPMEDVLESARQWEEEQQIQHQHTEGSPQRQPLLEECYRVGTTVKQCQRVLELSTEEQIQNHDRQVVEQMRVLLNVDKL